MRVTRPSSTAFLLLLLASPALAFPSLAAAQITQPNGVVYPVNPNNGETQLFTLFSNRSEDIDWVNDASQQPNTFSPLCDFSATVVLKQTGSSLNVGWYNVTGAQPTAAEIYPIFPGAVTQGMSVTGQAIRENAN
mgnify:FL=1